MNYTALMCALLFFMSFSCYADIKDMLKKCFPCCHPKRNQSEQELSGRLPKPRRRGSGLSFDRESQEWRRQGSVSDGSTSDDV